MTLIIPTESGFRYAAKANLVGEDDSRMVAWVEKFVRKDRDLAWVHGNFVEADNANNNGHIFPLKDLEEASVHTVVGKPLNMLHHENYIVGAYAGAEMVYPEASGAEQADDSNGHPYMEALAGMWKHIYPDEHRMLQKAQAEGSLFFSMEAVAETLTFVDYNNVTVPYMGRSHDSYPTKDLTAKRILNKPHFSGGAIIIPPVRPGWSKADIKALDSFIEKQPSVAEAIFAGLETELPHLGQPQWELMMKQLITIASSN